MYVKIFTKYPYLKWAFHFHNPISSLYHLLIWMPGNGADSKEWDDSPLIKYLREIYGIPEKDQCENVHIILPLKKHMRHCYPIFTATGFRKHFPVTELIFSKAVYCG